MTLETARDHPVDAFDPLNPATLQCPFPWHRALREQAPVHFVESRGMWFVTSHELVTRALGDHASFSSDFGVPQMPPPESVAEELAEIRSQGWAVIPTLLTADPPAHHYYRRMVARAFTPKFVAQREPDVGAIASSLVARLPVDETVEFVTTFAAPLPLLVIARVLNVPDERIDDFKRWSDQFASSIGAQLDAEASLEQARNFLEFQRFFAGELEDRRVRPQDDLLTGLVNASAHGEDEPLSTAASLSILSQLLIAGNETSTKLMTGTLDLLAREPQWWEWLRADPVERSGAVVEEALRILTPVQSMFRIATRDVTLGGCDIPAGAVVILAFGSANRDDGRFADAERFNPERADVKAHMAFGDGIHACLGAPLARLQARIALAQLAERFTRVVHASDNDFVYEPSFMLRGLTRLSLVFEGERHDTFQ